MTPTNQTPPTKKQSEPAKVEDLDKRHPRKEFKGFAPNGAMMFGRIDYTQKMAIMDKTNQTPSGCKHYQEAKWGCFAQRWCRNKHHCTSFCNH